MTPSVRGRLIVLEGVEGAGKTTQVRRLAAHLASLPVAAVTVREPGQTTVGEGIRQLVLHGTEEMAPRTEALLYMASRAELVERVVRPALAQGTTVIADRFFLSTYAYQAAGRGLPEDEVRAANAFATGGLVPDLTVLLVMPPDEGLARAAQRGAHDRIERASPEFHERVAAAFARSATPAWQASHPEAGPIAVVDAVGSEDQVFARVWGAIAPVLEGAGVTP
ncbi:MAG: dTMP kinase [Gemmatimonadetes bacterium]|nr:dTMP kinase [Gemmatimonadota bacterium]